MRYLDVLQELASSYNLTFHRSIQMHPEEMNAGNRMKVFHHLYGKRMRGELPQPKFKAGDAVRISKECRVFMKGYDKSFTDEHFLVDKIIK